MRTAAGMAAALAGFFVTAVASADPLLIGVAAQLEGPSAILGRQISAGAVVAAKKLDARLEIADDRCSAEGGVETAQRFVEAKVAIVIGYLCTESIEAALPILKNANIPVITVGVRTDSLTDQRHKTGWPIYRLGPRADGERNAAATILTRLWADKLFAVIDDGTIYGRELAEAFRAAAEQARLKPAFIDTFRPQLDNQIGLIGRLRKAGATHAFVGGDGEDIAVMGRDAAALNVPIVFAGGETLRIAERSLPPVEGTIMIAPPEWATLASPEVKAAFAAQKATTDGYALPAYAAVEIARAAADLATAAGKPLGEMLSGRDFTTAIGTVRFDDKGDLAQSPYRAFRSDGSKFVPIETK